MKRLSDDAMESAVFDDESLSSCSSQFVSLGLCQLNQWALDFDGNSARIIESIKQVREKGGFYRIGPELEVCGYSCDDHFLEADTCAHSWQCIKQIMVLKLSHNCLLDIGMPVEHRSIRYNCRVFILNDKIILIRPKMFLANDGNYRESRYFGVWSPRNHLDEYVLPKSVAKVCNQDRVPFGFASIECNDCSLASESCEELFAPESPHLQLCLDGVEIFTNGSGSYHEFRKLRKRMALILAPTRKMGGIYMYSNMKGCDSGRLYFDGSSFIACNGDIVNMMTPFNLRDVEVSVSHVNVAKVRSLRASLPSFAAQGASAVKMVPRIRANIWLSGTFDSSIKVLTNPQPTNGWFSLPTGYEEMAHGPACWLWDYLRRSGASGFFIAISGGADSGSVATIAYLMCIKVITEVRQGNEQVIQDLERIIKFERDDPGFPREPRDLCFQILHSSYLGTRHSSQTTRTLAANLCEKIGSYHTNVDIDGITSSFSSVLQGSFGLVPHFKRQHPQPGEPAGSEVEDKALQNVQARSRMVLSYMLASLLPWIRAKDRLARPPSAEQLEVFRAQKDGSPHLLTPKEERRVGFLLVLSTGNVDETLRGYFTKYDCSSGDLNPIGTMSKMDIRAVMKWAIKELGLTPLQEILDAVPTAELRPNESHDGRVIVQTDEEEMGMTYEELMLFGRLRKVERAGPVEMFELLVHEWRNRTAKATPGPTQDMSELLGSIHMMTGPSLAGPTLAADAQECFSTDRRNSVAPHPIETGFLSDENLTLEKIAERVKHFFRTYAENRHKVPTLTPAYHGEPYSCDERRFDWRPIVYPNWSMQFRRIDELVKLANAAAN